MFGRLSKTELIEKAISQVSASELLFFLASLDIPFAPDMTRKQIARQISNSPEAIAKVEAQIGRKLFGNE